MKIKKYILVLPFAGLLQAACTDLDLRPEGGMFTEDQKKELINLDPEKVAADVNGLYSGLMRFNIMELPSKQVWHADYGYASACMIFDASGMDQVSIYSGFYKYLNSMRFFDRTETSSQSGFLWKLFYFHMKTANDIIRSIDPQTKDETLQSYLGQALASRAFDYLNLVQIYQFTYKGHEDAPAVPIITEKTTSDDLSNNPRATVKQVYELILKDLNQAIPLLEKVNRGEAKETIDQSVAYGLRARANLLMQNWKEAAEDASKVIAKYTPYSLDDLSRPRFNDIKDAPVVWGIDVTPNAEIVNTGICNFTSMMSSFSANAYSYYAPISINQKLYETIPETDVRKGWWFDKKGKSKIVPESWYESNAAKKFLPYKNAKFGPYNNDIQSTVPATDFPMMRVEEMLLIKAEALGMSGNVDGGKKSLEDFVKTYRDEAYTCKATDAKSLQDEVWHQRRIELWGEGFGFFDLLRLKKPVERVDTNFPEQVRYNLPAESPIFLWLIYEGEMNTNKGIGANNPVISAPKV